MRKFCDYCGCLIEANVITKKETYMIFGEEVKVDAEVLVCGVCGKELFFEDLDEATLVAVRDIYNNRHK